MSNKAYLFIKLDKLKDAILILEKVIESNPNNYSAWVNKSLALNRLGERIDDSINKALKIIDETLENNPNDDEAWFNRAAAYSLMKDVKNTLISLEKAFNIDRTYINQVNEDLEFEKIRNQKEFKDLLDKFE